MGSGIVREAVLGVAVLGGAVLGGAVLEGAVLEGMTVLTIQSVPVGPLLLCVVSRGVVMQLNIIRYKVGHTLSS